jgi:hypothetical protein
MKNILKILFTLSCIIVIICIQFLYGRYELILDDVDICLLWEKNSDHDLNNCKTVFFKFDYRKQYTKVLFPVFKKFIFSYEVDISRKKLESFFVFLIKDSDTIEISSCMSNDLSYTAYQRLIQITQDTISSISVIYSDSCLKEYDTHHKLSLYDNYLGNMETFKLLMNDDYLYFDGGYPTGIIFRIPQNINLNEYEKLFVKIQFENKKDIEKNIELNGDIKKYNGQNIINPLPQQETSLWDIVKK